MIWFVGNVFRDVREYLDATGQTFGVFVNDARPVPPALRSVTTIPLNFNTLDTLTASADAAGQEVSAVLSAGYENYVLPAAILAHHFDVPGLSATAAAATTDKSLMRARLRAHDTRLSPDFALVHTWDDIAAFMRTHAFPVMLKPTNLMKSLFITQNSSVDSVRRNYNRMLQQLANIHDRIYTLAPPQIIIEECMSGSMHTVAGYADKSGRSHLMPQIVDCITGQDIGRDDNYLYSRQLPSTLDTAMQRHVLDVAAQGVQALGLSSTMLHIELMVTPDGPKIIEIGARIGGYRTRMYAYAAHINLNKVMVDVSLGNTPYISTQTGKSVAVIELFPETEGSFAGIASLAGLENLASLRYLKVKAHPGGEVGRSSQGFKAAAIVILENSDTLIFERDLNFVRNNVSIDTKAV